MNRTIWRKAIRDGVEKFEVFSRHKAEEGKEERKTRTATDRITTRPVLSRMWKTISRLILAFTAITELTISQ